jgi:hypothetical protein
MAKLSVNHRRLVMPKWQKWLVYAFTALLFVSGAAWLYADWYLTNSVLRSSGLDETVFQIQAYKKIALQLHGTCSLGALLVFGTLLNHHIPTGWRLGVNRASGTLNVISIAILIITTVFIWYGKLGIFRDASAWLHWGFGLLLPVVIALHRKGSVR